MTNYTSDQYMSLIEICNTSDSSKVSELLIVAYDMIIRTQSSIITKLRKEKSPDRKRFTELIKLEAFESAVMILLPQNVQYSIYSQGESSISFNEKGRRLFYDGLNNDPVISLLSAILSYYYTKLKDEELKQRN